jgi:predicted CoA-binding protein
MRHRNPSESELATLLSTTRTIAVVGASSNPGKPSHGIFRQLQRAGYRVIPVNPNETEVLGERAYPSLEAVPGKVDLVNVFRRAEFTPDVADSAVAIGADALWLQLGIVNEDAARRAMDGGLKVVMDECIGVVHAELGIAPKT